MAAILKFKMAEIKKKLLFINQSLKHVGSQYCVSKCIFMDRRYSKVQIRTKKIIISLVVNFNFQNGHLQNVFRNIEAITV